MGHGNLNDDWAGLEPEQPPSRNQGFMMGVAAIIVLLAVVCAVAAYFIWAQFQARTGTESDVSAVTPVTDESGDNGAPPVVEPPATPTETAVPPDPATPTPTATAVPAATSTPATVSSVDAIALSSPPLIDGNLAEWDGVPAYLSAFQVYAAGSWDGTDDLTAVWRLGWDANNLYIAVEVTDNIHVQTQTGNTLFRGDSVDMQFDTNRPADFGDGLSPDDFQITFSPGDFAGLPPSAWRYQGTTSGAILDAPGGNRVVVAAQRTTTGYNLEAAIPWGDLNTTPSTGLVLGLSLNVSDNDSPGTAVQEVMKSHVSTRTLTNPSSWGTLTLR